MATRTELLDLATNDVNTARTAGLYPDTDKAATDARTANYSKRSTH